MGCTLEVALPSVKIPELDENVQFDIVKNRLIQAVVQMTSAWFVKNGCNVMKFVERCLIPSVLPYGSHVFVLASAARGKPGA